jgi:hypothetical protein
MKLKNPTLAPLDCAITDFQRNNLTQLKGFIATLDRRVYLLDMSTFFSPAGSKNIYEYYPEHSDFHHECGTTCCVVGYAVLGRIGKITNLKDQGAYGFNFHAYSEYNLVKQALSFIDDSCRIPSNLTVWAFLFSHHNPDSFQQALNRVDIILRGAYDEIEVCLDFSGCLVFDYDHKY